MEIDLSRKFYALTSFTDKEISEANLQMMPGFRLSWYYSGIDLKPDPLLDYPVFNGNTLTYQYKNNKEFIREAYKKPSYILVYI